MLHPKIIIDKFATIQDTPEDIQFFLDWLKTKHKLDLVKGTYLDFALNPPFDTKKVVSRGIKYYSYLYKCKKYFDTEMNRYLLETCNADTIKLR